MFWTLALLNDGVCSHTSNNFNCVADLAIEFLKIDRCQFFGKNHSKFRKQKVSNITPKLLSVIFVRSNVKGKCQCYEVLAGKTMSGKIVAFSLCKCSIRLLDSLMCYNVPPGVVKLCSISNYCLLTISSFRYGPFL